MFKCIWYDRTAQVERSSQREGHAANVRARDQPRTRVTTRYRKANSLDETSGDIDALPPGGARSDTAVLCNSRADELAAIPFWPQAGLYDLLLNGRVEWSSSYMLISYDDKTGRGPGPVEGDLCLVRW